MKIIQHLTLSKKFFLGVGIIIVFFWALFSYLIYIYLSEIYRTDAFSKTNLLYQQIQSTMSYVRENLRPRMFHILPENQFIKEAMSVSFITKNIMNDFIEKHPNVKYRRVSLDPLNPENLADEREASFIAMFKEDRSKSFWKGIQHWSDERYAIHAKPIIMEKECLTCHGRPEDAPEVLRKSYDIDHGFNKKVGDIIGVEYLALPLNDTFAQIEGLVWTIFIAGIIGMVLMFIAINSLINLVAVRPLGKVRSFFRSVVQGDMGLDAKFAVKTTDEIGELAHSFNRMMEYLQESQQRLISSEKKYRQIFEGSKDTILVADCNGTIQDINHAGTDLLDINANERVMLNMKISDLFHNPDDYTRFIEEMSEHGSVKDFETRFVAFDGQVMDILISASYRDDEYGNVYGFEAIIKDITERKRLIRQMNEAERISAVGQLAAGIAHEINNPLGIIIGYTGLLLDDLAIHGPFRDDLQTIHANANTCKKIIEDLLSFSRKSEPNFDYHDIHEVIDSVINMLSYEFGKKEITLETDYTPELPSLYIDEDKIRQVLINTLINAYQAVTNRGRIRISTSLDGDRDIVRIDISDNGHGIDSAIRDKIFQPFFTTKPTGEGTGLGLSVSYGIIREHGGTIEVRPDCRKETTFSVYLPIARHAAKEQK